MGDLRFFPATISEALSGVGMIPGKQNRMLVPARVFFSSVEPYNDHCDTVPPFFGDAYFLMDWKRSSPNTSIV